MRYLFAILLLFLIGSCSKQRAALYHFNQVNDLINNIATVLKDYSQQIDESIAQGKIKHNVPEAENIRQRMIKKFESAHRKIKRIHTLDGDNSLKDAANTYAEGVIKMYNEEFRQYISVCYSGLSQAELTDSLSKLLVIIQDKGKKYAAGLINAKEVFAKKYGLTLLNKNETEESQ